MFNIRLNESKYPQAPGAHRLNKFYIHQRVIYSGRTNYSYGESAKDLHHTASKEYGTVINKTKHNVTIQLDEYKKPYLDNKGILCIPPKQYAIVTECDLACGCKVLDSLY